MNRFQLQAAVATAQISKMPVLLTVPEMVMLSPSTAPLMRNASPDSAGFEVFSRAIGNLLNEITLVCTTSEEESTPQGPKRGGQDQVGEGCTETSSIRLTFCSGQPSKRARSG